MNEQMKKLVEAMKQSLPLKQRDIRTYNPLTLAFIGDGVYDLVIRTLVVTASNVAVDRLHRDTAHYVKAATQSAMMEVLMPELTEQEITIFKRGRNSKVSTMAKNASMIDYRRATGFEALMGYLYLDEQFDRMLYLISLGLNGIA